MSLAVKQLQQGIATLNQVVGWNGTNFAPQDAGLDAAYDFSGSGAGRVITADAGAVHIDKTTVDANNAFEVSVTTGSGAAVSVTMGAASTGPGVYANAVTGASGFLIQLQSNAANILTVAPTGVTAITASADIALTVIQTGAFRALGVSSPGGFPTGGFKLFSEILDTSARATGVGGSIALAGDVNVANVQPLVELRAQKDNSTIDDRNAHLVVYSNTAVTNTNTATASLGLSSLGVLKAISTGVIGWSTTADPTTAATSGFSQLGAASVALGNGSPGDTSGKLSAYQIALSLTTAVTAIDIVSTNLGGNPIVIHDGVGVTMELTNGGIIVTNQSTAQWVIQPTHTNTGVAGFSNTFDFSPIETDGGGADSNTHRTLFVDPTINFTASTGHYEILTVDPQVTNAPSGTNLLAAYRLSGADRFILASTGAVSMFGSVTRYRDVATTGWGVGAIYASDRLDAQTTGGTVTTYTVGAADGSFLISVNINVTAVAVGLSATVSYTDETGTPITATLPFTDSTGSSSTVLTATGPYHGPSLRIRAQAATAITVATLITSGTFNVEADITQVR